MEHLLFYSLLYALFRLAVHKPLCVGSRLGIAWIISAVVFVSAANYLIRPLWLINDWKFLGGFLWAEPADLPQYAVLFVMGMIAFRGDWFRRIPRTMGRVLFGLIALFRFCFDKTSPVMRWLAAQSYAAYLIHIFVIVGLQHLFDRVPMGGGTGKIPFYRDRRFCGHLWRRLSFATYSRCRTGRLTAVCRSAFRVGAF